MVGWLERRCAANSQGVEVDFIQVRLGAVTCAVYTFCLVPPFFLCVFSAISVAPRYPSCRTLARRNVLGSPPQEDILLSF